MWTKERIKDQIYKTTPNDVVIQNLSFFPSKVVITGYCHVSKLGQLKSNEKNLSLKSSWQIRYSIIPVSGNFNKEILDSLLSILPRLEINSITVDDNRKLLYITFQNNPVNFLNQLNVIESKVKVKIKVNSLENEKYLSTLELTEISKKNDLSEDLNNSKIDLNDLKIKIEGLLPSWIKTSKITLFNDRVEIQTDNDISDIERIGFLTLLLESQIGLKIDIKQSYKIENQIETLTNLLKLYFTDFSIKQKTEQELVSIIYYDFPLTDESLQKIKSEMYKKTKLTITEFISKFEEKSEKICLDLKEWMVRKYPIIEYCFVYYNNNANRFDIVFPEDNSLLENLTLDIFNQEIKLEYKFPYPFQVKWIEEDPVFYLEQRIFIREYRLKLQKIQYDKPKINIYYKDISSFPFLVWEQIVFRLTRFEIIIIDADSLESKELFEFKDFLLQLDNAKISDLLIKVIPQELDEEIHSIIFDEVKNKFIIRFGNFFKKHEIKLFAEKWKEKLGINIEIIPAKDPGEIIFQIVSNLPDWIINPKIHFDNQENLLFIVQNDYEDEKQLEKYVDDLSVANQIPIKLEMNLTVSRIKQIIYQSLDELIEISRLKVYPEKNNIYFEGILKSDQDEDLLEEELVRIEAKTKFTVESYIKRKNLATNKQSVHDLLQKLLNSNQIIPFSDELYKESEAIELFDFYKHSSDRIDFRDLDCFSIDPSGTKAIDECISVQRITHQNKEDELLIGIHVSDVSFFVQKDSLIDKEAKRRSFSVYLNHEKITYPLFPETLIEKMSLQENIDRPAISLFIRSTLDSNIEEYFIRKTIIKNKKQFSYSEVNENLIEQKGEFLTDLQVLVSLTSQFKSNRIIRGSINLDFMPDNIADQIVSEIMIMANRLVGFHLQSLPGQKIFRNQHIQSYTYLLLQKNFASLGYNLDILNKNPLTDLNRILQEAALNGDSELLMSELRNYLSNSYYSHTCTGHEALGTKWYSQWTSPLRKYMDLVVHRLLNKEYVEDLHYLCQYSSAVERLLKIKIDSSLNTYFIDKINSIIGIDKEILVSLLKSTTKHMILSTDQDFFLFVLISEISANSVMKSEMEGFINYITSNPSTKIKIKNLIKDKKDLNIYFSYVDNNKPKSLDELIKAKLIFLDQ